MARRGKMFWTLCLSAGVVASLHARAEVQPEEVGQVMQLPEAVGNHWVWVPDLIFRHSLLFDGDTGSVLGAIDGGMSITPKTPLWSKTRSEIYNVDTIYSRGHRGERKDFVVIYDSRTLDVKGEVEIPPKAADTGTGIALLGMLDGDRFIVVLNQSPGSSVSVVDVEARRFVGEIPAAGCAGVYPAGQQRFGMLCGDGTALTVLLKDNGELEKLARSGRFFDVVADPITEKGVRSGSSWWFASFEGFLYEVDFGGDAPTPKEPWPLFTEKERKGEWRIGGAQHLAYHTATKRLYSIVHKGGPGSHKDPGRQIWVYDTSQRKKTDVFSVPNLLVAFIRPQLGIEADGFVDWLLKLLLPNPGVQSVAVTQDESPLLFVRHMEVGAVGVLDAASGEHIRDLEEAGFTGALLVVP